MKAAPAMAAADSAEEAAASAEAAVAEATDFKEFTIQNS